jgi:hypothetical protein
MHADKTHVSRFTVFMFYLTYAFCVVFPGRGIPNMLGANDMTAPIIAQELLPCASDAGNLYFADIGRRLTEESVFGRNPFSSEEETRACEQQFSQQTPEIQTLLSAALHGHYGPIQEAVLRLVDLTRRLS